MIDWKQHLPRASRPLAIAVLSLEEPLRQSVTLGIVALQTLQDLASVKSWSTIERRRALLLYFQLTVEPTERAATQLSEMLDSSSGGSPVLVRHLSDLIRCIERLAPIERQAIWRHARHAAERRLAFVMRTRSDGQVVLRRVEEVAGFCEARRGIAAELITDLMVAAEPSLLEVAEELQAAASPSALGIGLVDYLDDLGPDGSCPMCVLEPPSSQ